MAARKKSARPVSRGTGCSIPAKPMLALGRQVRISLDAKFFKQDKIGGISSHYTGYIQPILPGGSGREKLLSARWEGRLYSPWTELKLSLHPIDHRFSSEVILTTRSINIEKVNNIEWLIKHEAAKFYVGMFERIEFIIDKKIGTPFFDAGE